MDALLLVGGVGWFGSVVDLVGGVGLIRLLIWVGLRCAGAGLVYFCDVIICCLLVVLRCVCRGLRLLFCC